MNAFLKRVWIGLAATLIVSLAAVVLPDQVQIDDDGRVHLGAPSSKPSGSASGPAPVPEPPSPPLMRDEVDEVIRTAVRAAGLDPEQGKSRVPAGSNLNRTGWTAVREKAAAPSEMKAICADLERQGWVLNPNGDSADASRSYKRGGWYLLVSTRGQTQAPSDTLSDSQTYLTVIGLQLNLSDIPLPEITVGMR
ncbi:hypothetical protein [Streptomyces sp. XY332]|uniref:hypothetical protein n=1 Tax=Streptomyces sp. XY332 TaxID=1415561 RepID=UPI0006C35DFB|nr:hypothetical protein [Streptomyces sp. XY332]KOY57493.1 hypothetical protein ADK59_13660 [Streptomyces sp. XY332]